MITRSEYYSQAEVLKLFKVSAQQYKKLIHQHQIPTVTRQIDFHTYQMNAVYVRKEDVEKLNLPHRK